MTTPSLATAPWDDTRPTEPEAAEAYRRDGHVVLRGVASADEVAQIRPVIGGCVQRMSTETRPLAERDTYGKAFLQVHNLWRADPAAAQFVLGKRFARFAAELMGVDAVRLYHDQALYKEPGGGFTPWHQDRFYWPLDTDKTITMWMPLVDVPAGMEWVSGSHRDGEIGRIEISDSSEQYFADLVADRQLPVAAAGPLAAGDATFHDGWSLHRAPGNDTDQMREVMTVIYFADGTRVGPADSDARRKDLADWLPGLAPGDVAASPLNPLLWSRADVAG
jgi:ectoine hydroxylase-related dioxygenase (phytanoyl-CoA dioxygenase family)